MNANQASGWTAGNVGVGLLVTLFAGTAVLTRADGRLPDRDAHQQYEIDEVVLESRDHGPELCAGHSLPPKCGGFPVEPFHWEDVDGEQSIHGTTWAKVHLVGTFDGRAFHPSARPSPPGPPPVPPPPATSPCAPPEGGWAVVDDSKVTRPDALAAMNHAEGQPEIAAVWFVGSTGPLEDNTPYGHAIVNLAFTGDLDRHQREARLRWGGPSTTPWTPPY